MAREQIRKAYRAWEMSYEDALEKLEALGMSEGQADYWLWNGYNGEQIK